MSTALVSTLFTLLIVLLILFVAYWAIHRLAQAFGVPAPIAAVLDVFLVIVLVFALIHLFKPLLVVP